MKSRIVETTGLSSYGGVNVCFAVEYKESFFSKWKTLYTTDWVDSKDPRSVKDRKTKCLNLLKALRDRGAHKIRTVLKEEK